METRKAQVIKCKCGKIFAACIAPQCYTNKEWIKDIQSYSKKGYQIDTLETRSFEIESCICIKQQTELFR